MFNDEDDEALEEMSRIPSADYTYDALLRHNYFPMVKNRRDDLPPVFHTEAFTVAIANDMIQAMQSHQRGSEGYDQVRYRANRFDNTARRMDIPHPLPYARFCKCIYENWSHFDYVKESETSQIKPKRHDGRLVVMRNYDSGRVLIMDNERFPAGISRHLSLSMGNRFLAHADIANCFPSIYSHAIAWGLVTIEHAKQNRGKGEWFNQIDFHQRQIKRGETLGVPIGPATSNIMAETVLCRIDEKLIDQGYSFIRFIDDYQCFTESRDDAEQFLRDLDIELDRYLLKLNRKKVWVDELPLPERSDWIIAMKFAIGSAERLSPSKMSAILDLGVQLQSQHKGSNVVKYTATTIQRFLTETNVTLYVQYLLQLAFHQSTVLPQIAEALLQFEVDVDDEVIDRLVRRHLQFRRSDAVCWSLTIASLAATELTEDLASEIVNSGDVMAMGMLIALGQHVDLVDAYLLDLDADDNNYELDQNWLLIHERAFDNSDVRRHFRSYSGDTGLRFLRDQSVRFIDRSRLTPAEREAARPLEASRWLR